MIYCETLNKECIAVHPLNNINNTQYIELIKYGDEPKFAVWVDDGTDEWVWEFDITRPSDYERVKMNIFDVVFTCDTMNELTKALHDVFVNRFDDILIDDECECCGDCGCCKFIQ